MASAGNVTVSVDALIHPRMAKKLERMEYDAFLYGTHKSSYSAFIPAEPPPVQSARLDAIEKMMTGPRPVADFPLPIFVGDYLNGIVLPWDWDPRAHLVGTGEWLNTTRFFAEGPFFNYKRLPVAPPVPGR